MNILYHKWIIFTSSRWSSDLVIYADTSIMQIKDLAGLEDSAAASTRHTITLDIYFLSSYSWELKTESDVEPADT